jgi:hypothetical protein
MSDEYLWDPKATPDPDIVRLETLLRPLALKAAPLRAGTIAARPKRFIVRPWLAAAAALVLAVSALVVARRASVTPWAVAARQGAPIVRSALGAVSPRERGLVTGGVVETDSRSVALVNVGRIGRAELGPGSRLRLLDAGTSEHRLSLERGTMHASIDAPPRYFLVETASALAVDLGCVYTLTADERGNGLLTVEEGEVELQRGDVRSAVLAGNSAALRPGRGPGLPYPVRSSAALQHAVVAYDADPAREGTVDALLAASDSQSTITLWHLLQRETPTVRERIYERLAQLSPPPATVTRDRVIRGESGALQRWRTELQRTWATEPPLWKQVWNTLRR